MPVSDIRLNWYNTVIVTFILNDSTILLSAMTSMIRKTDKNEKNVFEKKKSLKKRIADANKINVTFHQETLESMEEALNRLKLQKLYTDKNDITKVLLKCGKEIKNKRTFKLLNAVIINQRRMQNEENNFIQITTKNYLKEHKIEQDLEKVLKNQNLNTTQLYVDIAAIDNINYDHTLNILRKKRYLNKWEQARIDLQKKYYNTIQNKYIKDYHNYEYLKRREIVVVSDIFGIINNQIELYKEECIYWMEKYESENDSIDIDIQIETENIAQKMDKYNKLLDDLDQRKLDMENFIKFKAQQKIERSAIKIQGWWRRLMYLRKKPKKPKKKSKSKKEKGKKRK